MSVDPAVQQLLDHRAITDVVLRYCRGVDRMDRELVRSCFHADAADDHGSFSGDRDGFIEWAFGLLATYDSTFHFVGNQLVSFDGPDVAMCETYGIAHHRKVGGPDHKNLITGFRYIDTIERRADAWRIAKRVAVTEWSRVEPAETHWAVPDGFLMGRRDTTDAVYRS